MPLYEYECSKCHHRFEKIEKVSASETQKCPKCGGKAPRQISRSAIQFKGSGWYVTDNGAQKPAEKNKDAGGKGEAAAGEGAGKSGETGEAKGSEKAESKPKAGGEKAKPAGKKAKKE